MNYSDIEKRISIEKGTSKYKVYYCPKCGKIGKRYVFDDGSLETDCLLKECTCRLNLPLFSKERRDCKFVPTEEVFRTSCGFNYIEGVYDPKNHYSYVFLNEEMVVQASDFIYKPYVRTFDFPRNVYEYFWEKYVDIEENHKLNREFFEKMKAETIEELEAPRSIGYSVNTKNSTSQKDASVVGRAVAGALIAGPAGAVVGALSAVDKNNKNRK